jgi:hypothetical protein
MYKPELVGTFPLVPFSQLGPWCFPLLHLGAQPGFSGVKGGLDAISRGIWYTSLTDWTNEMVVDVVEMTIGQLTLHVELMATNFD